MFNPRNWRIQSGYQQDAEGRTGRGGVGATGDSQQTHREPDRRALALSTGCEREGATTIPVVYIDVSEEEEALVLATLDPIAAMAATDKVGSWMNCLQTLIGENENVKKMLDEIAERKAGFMRQETC